MKSHSHSPGTDAAAAHRQELDTELPGGKSEMPGLTAEDSKGDVGADRGATSSEVFRDLRRRNARRARFARLPQDRSADQLKVERIEP